MGWVPAGDGYEVALVEGQVRCCNSAGRVLKAVPNAVQQSDTASRLARLAERLDRHNQECLRTVEDWMVNSRPVPAAVIAAVWPDTSWRAALADVFVMPVGDEAAEPAGFLARRRRGRPAAS